MVCIAAFIILAVVGVFVAVASIFEPKLWKSYTKALKKAWGCLWKKVRLQKCETGFKEDVKNTLLSKIIIKHPKWVKPLSILIEIFSVIIVVTEREISDRQNKISARNNCFAHRTLVVVHRKNGIGLGKSVNGIITFVA